MNIAVAVKRVPAPGAKIVLTPDALAIETKLLGFAISPHEECAVEEAVRLVEKHGGSVTVMALGPVEAIEQLRAALAVGADDAVLLKTDGSEWDPQATASALAEAMTAIESDKGGFDLILVGNESADSGGYQVGVRLAHHLGRPIVTGIKGLEVVDETLVARRQTADGYEVYQVDLPAVAAVKEGINLPRYPTLKGRLRAKSHPVVEIVPIASPGGLQMLRLQRPPDETSQTEILGSGPEAAPRVIEVLTGLGLVAR